MTKVVPSISSVAGFKVSGIHANLKADKQLDMTLIASDRNCTAGAVFTSNQVKAAPVLLNMEYFDKAANRIRAVIINTKNANAGTGKVGLENARTMSHITAELLECDPEQVFVMSTGVIGEHLPMDKIDAGIHVAFGKLGQNWENAARGIMTTDTRPKWASVTIQTMNGEYTIAGITKGAGMIAPDMATMLGVLVTDANISAEQNQKSLKKACDLSYNRIVVDGDTSTNDMVVLLANGASGVDITSQADIAQFETALTALGTYLAQEVVRDGEGVTKFITIEVTGANSDADAKKIANTIANSPLVKTAFYGNDANVGRFLMAAGRAGVAFEPEDISLWIAEGETLEDDDKGLMIFQHGTKTRYKEEDASAIISADSVYVSLDMGVGDGHAIIWTCDLSHEYISINADYRT